jgi:hypothetical protein
MTYHHRRRVLWAFGAECLFIGLVVLLMGRLPNWILMVALIIATGLPIICALAIIAKPEVYHGWQAVIGEVRLGLRDGARWLWGCCSMQNAIRAARSITKMRVCPSTADDWFAVVLLPFKVYALTALPLLRICYWLSKLLLSIPTRSGYYEAVRMVSAGYSLCLPVLLLGALLQAMFSSRGRSTQTVLVFLFGAVMYWALWPWGRAGR